MRRNFSLLARLRRDGTFDNINLLSENYDGILLNTSLLFWELLRRFA
ncbi:MAG: hypothetical protein IJU48_10340 [Synergistaceae bacterium]|nr:hypothetical protein [Synergistaceae bacterium]